jgi:hypothetical protein
MGQEAAERAISIDGMTASERAEAAGRARAFQQGVPPPRLFTRGLDGVHQPVAGASGSAAMPRSVDGFETVRVLGGSSYVMLKRDPSTGALFAVKELGDNKSFGSFEAEIAGNAIYRLFGATSPEAATAADGRQTVLVSRYVESRAIESFLSDPDVAEAQKDALRQEVAGLVVLSGLLNNWDFFGRGRSNINVTETGAAMIHDTEASFDVAGGAPTIAETIATLAASTKPFAADILRQIDADALDAQIADVLARRDDIVALAPAAARDALAERIDTLRAPETRRDIAEALGIAIGANASAAPATSPASAAMPRPS